MSGLLGHWIARPWGRMRVWRSEGSGATVLAVHGLGGSGRYWQGLADRFRVVAPDLAGFGASDKPRSQSYDRSFHLANLDAALDAALGRDDPVAVLGHSIGGTLAALWAAERAARTRALVLAAAPFPTADGGHPWMRQGRPPPGMRLAARGMRMLVPILSLPVGLARGYPAPIALDYGRQRLHARARTMWSVLHDPDVAVEFDSAREGLDRVPVLLAHADDDRTVRADAVERWTSLVPNADRVDVPTGGHQFLLRGGLAPVVRWLQATLDA